MKSTKRPVTMAGHKTNRKSGRAAAFPILLYESFFLALFPAFRTQSVYLESVVAYLRLRHRTRKLFHFFESRVMEVCDPAAIAADDMVMRICYEIEPAG